MSQLGCISFESYIKPQPGAAPIIELFSCISFESYIKPQLQLRSHFENCSCISFESYIKPQLALQGQGSCSVVYLLNPTSNHNLSMPLIFLLVLYIF